MDEPSRSTFAAVAAHFDALRDADAATRREALAGIDDATVRGEVDRLLQSHDRAATDAADPLERGLPDTSAADLLDALQDATATPEAAEVETTGRWEAVREIGRGGMGTVWLARRTGADFEQVGALKLLRTAPDDPDVQRRFRAERRILASLEHPNIAKFLDGGTTAEGRPFVVMEFVDGDDLITHADRENLDVRARVALFRKVCSAVEHAHAALVVHRDLKPSNVLVGRADGEPKLLDFGIAKLLRGPAERDDARTLPGVMLLTPEYASPEQVRGAELVTVATDVYALGLVLYELLSGQRAQVFETTGATELARVVCDTDPPMPSQAATRALSPRPKLLAGDLDAIVMKALRKEPELRYASAAGLDEDLQRYLEGMPVRARRGTTAYRLSRFVRRNRVPLAAVLLVFVLVVAASIGLFRQASALRAQAAQLEEQRDVARRENLVATEVAEFLIDLFEIPRHEAARASRLTARDLLDLGARRIETEVDSGPLVRASLLDAMGRAYSALGVLDEADRLLVESQAIRAETGSLEERLEAASALVQLRRMQSRFEEAIAVADAAVAPLDVDADHSTRTITAVSAALLQRGLAELALGRTADASASADAIERWLGLEVSPEAMGDVMFLRAQVAHERGELAEAEQLLLEALAVVATHDVPSGTSMLLGYLGEVQKEQGRYEDALESLRRANQIDLPLFGEGHPRVQSNLYVIASLLDRCGRFDEAIAILEGLVASDRERYGVHLHTSLSIAQLGLALESRGEFDRALALYEEALEMQRQLLPEDAPEIINTISNIGVLYANSGREREATPYFEKALAVRSATLPAGHPDLLTSHSLMALARLAQGDLAGAEAEYEAVYEGRRAVLGDHPETAGALYSLAVVAHRKGDAALAEERARGSAELYRRVLPGGRGVDLVRPQQLLAKILMRRDPAGAAQAEPVLRENLEILGALEPDHPMRVGGAQALAECLWRRERAEEALVVLDRVRAALPEGDPRLDSVAAQRAAIARSLESGPSDRGG